MAITITPVFEGTVANDGTGDPIRDAFNKIDDNIDSIVGYLTGAGNNDTVTFLHANAETFSANIGFFTNLSSANLLATSVNITGNLTAANIISDIGLYSSGATVLSGETSVQTLNLLGNTNVTGAILPTQAGIDIGSPTQTFRYIYATPVTSAIILPSVSSGFIAVHTDFDPASYTVKDVGVVGRYNQNSSNLYAFFGYQASTDNFVYKLTPTDHTDSGETQVTDGVYGNVEFGSLLLSNTVATSANTLIVNGDTSINGNLFVSSNIYSNSSLVVGTATVNNMIVTGTVQGALNVSGTVYSNGYEVLNIGAAGAYNLFSGGIVLGNVLFPTSYDAVSQSEAGFVVGGGIGVGGNIIAGGFVGPYYGTIITPEQTNITTVGTLGNLTVNYTTTTNRLNAQTIGVTDATITGNLYIQAGTISGVNALTVDGNITTANVSAGIIGNVGATLTGTLNTATQTGITRVGTLTLLSVSGNITAQNSIAVTNKVTVANLQVSSNIIAQSSIAVTNKVTAANLQITSNIIGQDSIAITNKVTAANLQITSNIIGQDSIAITNKVTTANLQVSSNIIGQDSIAITNKVTAANLRVTGNTIAGNILPSAGNTFNLGSSNTWWNSIYTVSLNARAADLAEKYSADSEYSPGTVVVFGGDQEITVTTTFADPRVAGTISTEPAYLMNSEITGLAVALRGRVPCQVIGPVQKGDLLVTAETPGFAISVGDDKSHGVSVFAKSLTTDLSEGLKVITAVIL